MKKALVVATVGGFIDFEKNNIKRLEALDYEVHVACAKSGWEEYLIDIDEKIIDIPFERNPFSKNNLKAYKKLKRIIDKENYQLIHCHTPIAGVFTRFAARKKRKTCTIIYTAHGFHFYKGAPRLNWLIYYPVEWISSWITDVLITINTEDFIFAKKKMHAKKIEYVPGIGIDIDSIRNQRVDRDKVRGVLGLREGQKMLFSVGEINENKNHKIIIEAMAKLGEKDLRYFIAGVGELRDELIQLSKQLGVQNQVHFLGYRKDIIALDKAADVFCFPSQREGLSVALMEAIASGSRVLCSNIRGNRDLAINNSNVILFDQNDVDDCVKKLLLIIGQDNANSNAIFKFSNEAVGTKMLEIYGNAKRCSSL